MDQAQGSPRDAEDTVRRLTIKEILAEMQGTRQVQESVRSLTVQEILAEIKGKVTLMQQATFDEC